MMSKFEKNILGLKKMSSVVRSGAFVFTLLGLVFSPMPAIGQGNLSQPASVRQLASAADEVIIEFSAPDYQIQLESLESLRYQRIILPGATDTAEENQPQLPVVGALVGVPAGAQAQLEILLDDAQTLPGSFNLIPSSLPAPNLQDLAPGARSRVTKPALASSTNQKASSPSQNVLYPVSPVQILDEAWLRDQRILRLAFYPFQVDSARGELTWHRRVQVRLTFHQTPSGAISAASPPAESRATSRAINPFESVLRENLINYAQARAWRKSSMPPSATTVSSALPSAASKSLAAAQPKYRISILADGLYRLTYENLSLAGVPVGSINPSSAKITNQGRMVAYYFDDAGQDGVFGPGDAFIIYAQKFYGDWMATRYTTENANWLTFSAQLSTGAWTTWKPSMNAAMLEKYTDENVYWLELGGQPGSQMEQKAGNVPGPASTSYRETQHLEESHYWKTTLFTGEDTWFWDFIRVGGSGYPNTDTRVYTLPLSAPAPGGAAAKLVGELVGAVNYDSVSPDHHIQVYLNDPAHSNVLLDATWDGKSRYHFEVNIDSSLLVDGANQLDLVVIKGPNVSTDSIYLDWFQIEYDRLYQTLDNRIEFSNAQLGDRTYSIDGFSTGGLGVYDISDPLLPIRITGFNSSGANLSFGVNQSSPARYFVGVARDVSVSQISAFTAPDFNQPADYIFISHGSFLSTLQPLVAYRAGQGFSTLLVDVDDLYNQFNDGIYNPIAIKNFLTYTFQNWSKPPTYVLLVGDGNWNFKGYSGYDAPAIYMPPFLSWVDPWQGEVDSANLLATVVGDDPLADVFIARMPVNNTQELTNIIDKTIAYEQSTLQDWQKRLLFIADNTPDPAGDFVASSEVIINEFVQYGYTADRIYLDSFTDTSTCTPPVGSRTCPAATQAILDDLNQKGALFVNFTGHAGMNYWTNELIFMNQDIQNLANGAKLPIVLSMTCLDGYWIHPNAGGGANPGPSLAEELLRAQQSGAVATFSPTGLGITSGHDVLQNGFYQALFRNNAHSLADATLSAKLRLYAAGYSQDLLHTFTIFGDPALQLSIQRYNMLPLVRKH